MELNSKEELTKELDINRDLCLKIAQRLDDLHTVGMQQALEHDKAIDNENTEEIKKTAALMAQNVFITINLIHSIKEMKDMLDALESTNSKILRSLQKNFDMSKEAGDMIDQFLGTKKKWWQI